MAVNASPMYQKAEERYRSAVSASEKVAALEEMLRLVPKHKASEKLQVQIKQKLKAARDEMQGGGKKGGGGQARHDPFHVAKQGAGQVLLLGAPNVGKSSIVGALTKAKVEIAEFPFSTHAAVPGMAHHEDVPVQLVDMPPVMEGQPQPGMMNAYRAADAVLLVVDLAAIELMDQFEQCIELLRSHQLSPVSKPELVFGDDLDDAESAALPKRTLVVANKLDTDDARDNFETMKELEQTDLAMLPISTQTGEGLDAMMAELFRLLNVVRVYAKRPGKPADKESPFILPVGSSVHDMAMLVHKDIAENLKSARVWGGDVHDGQQVHATHVLTDKNVVELHG
ncbi:MAG: 50S ribosome-binding GTPase [Phycisphaerales bacterium]|nr:50S ribosome-binding GTPase [Phycisphaerales bacterium]